VTPYDGRLSPELNLNITPWVKFGTENEIFVFVDGPCAVEELSIEFHRKGTFP
jgi:hypothetical protein